MIDFNSLKQFSELQQKDVTENLIPIASEKEMLNANFVTEHTYKVIMRPAAGRYGSAISKVRIYTNDDTDYLVKSELLENTSSKTVFKITGNTDKEYVFPLTITAGSTYGGDDTYKPIKSFLDGGNVWVWLSAGGWYIPLTYEFECRNISTFQFQPNWNGHGNDGRYGSACIIQVYCDDKLVFDQPLNGLQSRSRINLKFSDYETCTSFVDVSPDSWY